MRFIWNMTMEEPVVFERKGNVVDEGCFYEFASFCCFIMRTFK